MIIGTVAYTLLVKMIPYVTVVKVVGGVIAIHKAQRKMNKL